MTMKKIYTLYQTNNPNTLGGYMAYSTLSEALDTIGQIGFNGMLIDTITAVTMVDSEWWHGHRTEGTCQRYFRKELSINCQRKNLNTHHKCAKKTKF